MKIIKKALLPSPVQANTTDEKIKGEFPRIRARITSKHTLFAFTTFTDGRWVFIKMTGKPHYFAPKYDTFHSLYRTGFGARLKNAVPNTLIFHWIAIDYIEICEGCESKKHKISVVCAHTRTRERARERESVEKTKTGSPKNASRKWEHISSEKLTKMSDVFQKTLDFFPKTWEIILRTWEINSWMCDYRYGHF